MPSIAVHNHLPVCALRGDEFPAAGAQCLADRTGRPGRRPGRCGRLLRGRARRLPARPGAASWSSAGTSTAAPSSSAPTATPADGYPSGFAEFLSELVADAGPTCTSICCCGTTRCSMPASASCCRACRWVGGRRERVTLCIDNSVPFGSSQHQKIVVVDDAVAFSGGLDLTIRRWDTTAHSADNRHRVDPSGHPYRPFHDVQMMVDGEAARALAAAGARALVPRQRRHAADRAAAAIPGPTACAPDFTDVDVGIARTQPRYDDEEPVREVETLFLDSIDLGRARDLHREPVPQLAADRRSAGRAAAPAARAARS